MKNGVWFWSSILIAFQLFLFANAQGEGKYQTIGRVDEKKLAGQIPDPQIWANDLSSDGKLLALFVVSINARQTSAPSWIVVANAASSEILKMERFGVRPGFIQGYAPQIAFTSDGKSLVVEDQQTVAVLDVPNLHTLRTIDPDRKGEFTIPTEMLVATETNTAVVSFGTGASRGSDGKWPTHNLVVDVTTGERLASWDADDIPMAISPHGTFLAISNHENASPTVAVKILDSRSGKSVAMLYPSPSQAPEKYSAVVMAKFLGDENVVLTPNNGADESGRDVASYLNIVRFKDSHPMQEIQPRDYGPVGEVVVSANQNTFVAVSRYLATKYREHTHWRIPSETKPELLVFGKGQGFQLDTRMPLPSLLGFRWSGTFDRSGVRISKDGSVISVAAEYGVTVFARK